TRPTGSCNLYKARNAKYIPGAGSAEEIVLRLADQGPGAAPAPPVPYPSRHGGGDAVRLAHDQLRRGGDLVRDGDGRDLELDAEMVDRAPVVHHGQHAGYANGDVGLADPPGPPEGVRDDEGGGVPGELADPRPQAPGRLV